MLLYRDNDISNSVSNYVLYYIYIHANCTIYCIAEYIILYLYMEVQSQLWWILLHHATRVKKCDWAVMMLVVFLGEDTPEAGMWVMG